MGSCIIEENDSDCYHNKSNELSGHVRKLNSNSECDEEIKQDDYYRENNF